jgi:hypothetical protein
VTASAILEEFFEGEGFVTLFNLSLSLSLSNGKQSSFAQPLSCRWFAEQDGGADENVAPNQVLGSSGAQQFAFGVASSNSANFGGASNKFRSDAALFVVRWLIDRSRSSSFAF